MAVDASTNRIVSGGNVVATYDEAGNQTGQNGTQSFGYDPFNMMRSRTAGGRDLTFLYTADDERIWEYELITNRSVYTVRNLDGKVLRVFRQDGDTWSWAQDYIHRPGALVAGVNAWGTYHFHVDHLGTPRSITDRFRNVAGTHHYYAFGEESTSNTQNSERMKFTGHERDTTFSNDLDYLDYMHARYYNPTTGRFLSMDPVVDIAFAMLNPQSWNRYSYVRNNPINRTDPTGKVDDEIAKKNRIAQGYAAVVGEAMVQDSVARARYVEKTSKLAKTDHAARNAAIMEGRAASTPVGANLAEAMKPEKTLGNYAGGTANKTRASVNQGMRTAGVVGRGMLAVGVTISAVNVANAPEGQKMQAVSQEAGAWAGALAFGAAGAKGGAAIGVFLGGPVGGVIGGAIGGIGGGIFGAIAGERAVDNVYDAAREW